MRPRSYSSRPNVEAKREERRKKVLELNKGRKTITAIAKELQIDRYTVANDLKFLKAQGEEVTDIHDNVALSRRRKWIEVIQSILDDVIPYFTSQGIKPSLRTAYYRLRATGLLKNTESDYDNLIRHTKEARLQETDRKGRLLYRVLPIDCFADETRKLIVNYDNDKPVEVEDPDDYIDDLITALRGLRTIMAEVRLEGVGTTNLSM